MPKIKFSPKIQSKVNEFLSDDQNALYLQGVAESIAANTSDDQLQLAVDTFETRCLAYGINIQYIYCNKTGRQIGTRERSEIELLFLLNRELQHTESAGSRLDPAYIEFTGGCSPAWINTDSNHLQSLMKFDPHGYVMYVLGFAARHAYKEQKQVGRKTITPMAPTPERSRAINQSLIRGYASLLEQPIEKVIEAAELLQRFFTVYKPSEVKWPMLLPHHYCDADGLVNLFSRMETQITNVVMERNLFGRVLSNHKIVEDIKKAGGTGGPSHIVGQGKKRGSLAMDQIADLFITMKVEFESLDPKDILHDETRRQEILLAERDKQKTPWKPSAQVKLNPMKKFSFTAKAT